ncbi:MAG: hypothetical protein WC054_04300 [Candidatus Nanopelagicales bacterium]
MPRHELRDAPGVLTAQQLHQTVDAIAAAQQPSGSLPWPDGHTDAWDHVECAMALTLGGRIDEARAAYEWLRRNQAADGSWAMSYDEDRVLDASVDTNQCAYIAVGMWQWWLVTADSSLPVDLWPNVKRALDFVVGMQLPNGSISWGRSPEGVTNDGALLTGSSSTYQALRCGLALADLVGEPQPEWEIAAGLLKHAVAEHPEVFLDKSRFSMDWYYPALGGAVHGQAAADMFAARWDDFIIEGFGARCVSDRPWMTGAETAELAMALIINGQDETAATLLANIQCLRREDGSYWTGIVVDEMVFWPGEASSWTSAAVVLACDALAGGSTLDLFNGRDLPVGLPFEEAACRGHEVHLASVEAARAVVASTS